MSVHFFAHWAAGGVAMALLAAALGASVPAAAAAAGIYLLCGPALSLLNFANLVPYLLWMPATMLAALHLVRRPGAAAAAGLAVCLALQTTFAEPIFLAAEAIAVAAVLAGAGRVPVGGGAREGGGTRSVGRAAGWAAAAGLVALLVSAPSWVPTAELVASSARGADAKASLGSSVPAFGLVQIAVPQLFGDYHTLEKLGYWGEIFNEEGKGPFFLSLSFGVTVLALAAAGAAGRPRVAGPLLVAAALGVVLGMGRHFAPLRPLLFSEGGGFFRWPVKFFFLAAVAVPPAAALGLDAVAAGRRRAAWTAAGVAIALAAAAMIALRTMGSAPGEGWLGWIVSGMTRVKDVPRILDETHARFLRTAAVAAVGGGLAAAAGLLAGRRQAAGVLAGLLFAVALFDLAPPQRAVNRGTPRQVLEVDTPVLREARDVAARGFRVRFPRGHWDVRVERAPGWPDEWWPRTRMDRELGNFYHAVGEGVPMVLLNPDRMVPAASAERARMFGLLRGADQEALLRLIGVAATVVVGPPALSVPGRRPWVTSAGYPVLLRPDSAAVPIASWVETLPELYGAAPWSAAFVREAYAHVEEHGDPAAVTVRERTPGRWVLDASAPRGGWVTLTETREPGWRVRIDGADAEPVPYLADFQAVRVPAGAHTVEWTYRPRAFTGLLAASALGAVALLLLLVRRTGGRVSGGPG
jgi:hypothetical protein